LPSLFARVAVASQRPAWRRFRRALGDVEGAQRRSLARLLPSALALNPEAAARIGPGASWEELVRRLPLTTWEDHAGWAEPLRFAPPGPAGRLRFEPTSGSTSARKWIPYPPAFRAELNEAASAWICGAAGRHPGILGGPHYWSLSWLPDDLRAAGQGADDLALLPPLARLVLRRLMAVPGAVATLPSSAEALSATLVHLAARPDLALVSAWSPTFMLRLVDALVARREQVAAVLAAGRWEAGGLALPWRAPRAAGAARLLREAGGEAGPGLTRSLWPRLALLSAWDSASSRPWAETLRGLFPQAAFEPKGLWSTEGVISIPFDGLQPLALTSHALEFRCLATGRVLPPWRLEAGQELQPVVSGSHGLLRYLLPDRVRVTGFLQQAPCIEFLGRTGGVDLVGEKVDAALAQEVLDLLRAEGLARPVTLLALPGGGALPRYRLLAAPGERGETAETVAARTEALLLRLHHYRLARELGQLGPAGAEVRADALEEYHRLVGRPAGADGQVKVEPVVALPAGGSA
jgi:hypothetical protein